MPTPLPSGRLSGPRSLLGAALVALLVLGSRPGYANRIGGEPPPTGTPPGAPTGGPGAPQPPGRRDTGSEQCPTCPTRPACSVCPNCPGTPPARPSNQVPGGSTISLSEGNLRQEYGVVRLRSTSGSTVEFSLAYNSYGVRLNVGVGDRWTHSYNVILFRQLGDMFRLDGSGRVTKFTRQPDQTFASTPGHFETLTENVDGTFTLRQKDGTVFTFAPIGGMRLPVRRPHYHLTRIVDRNGNTTALDYVDGNLVRITDPYGRQLTLDYDVRHQLRTITDPLGRVTTLGYGSGGRRLESITDPDGEVTRFSYGSRSRMVGKVDRDGRTFSYRYERRLPVAIEDGGGSTVFRLANPSGWATDRAALNDLLLRRYVPSTTTRTDGRGNAWTYDYDADGYVTRIGAPDGTTTRFTYDPATLMLASRTDANGHTTSYEYDAAGNLVRQTDALGHVATYAYEPVFDMMTGMTDANGRVTTFEYDARGNRIRETDPLGATREWTYDARGNVLTEKDKNGNVAMYGYDAAGNRVTIVDPLGHVSTMTYDVVGNALSRTDANGHTTAWTYDGSSRRLTETDHVGGITRIFYDGEGNPVRMVDRNGNEVVYAYDLRARLVRKTDALGQAIVYAYDGNDNRTSVTDENAHTTSLQYDLQNRITAVTDAVGNVRASTYDGAGNPLTETDGNGHTTTHEYDALDRVVRTTDAEGNVTQQAYDIVGLSGCPQCTGPTRGSRLVTKQVDAEGKVTYWKYDALDRPIVRVRKDGDTADLVDASDAVTRYGYDPQDNLLSVTEPNGNTATEQFDALNRAITLTNAAGDVTLTSYDPVGTIASVTLPNGNVVAYTYDALDRLVQVDDEIGRVTSYTYDAVGNRLTAVDGNGNGTTTTYDPLYRATDVTDALGRTTHYDFDAVGNPIRRTDREGKVTTYLYDAVNRRTRTTDALGNVTQHHYDGVGNVLRVVDANGHATDYAYDLVNRLRTETYADGRLRTFAYDGVGKMTARTDQQGQVTGWVYDDLSFLRQRTYPSSPSDVMTYDLSGRMLTAERGGWTVSFAYDGANRVTQTTQNGQSMLYVHDVPGRTRTLTYPGGRTLTETTDARGRLLGVDDGSSPPIVTYAYDLADRYVSRSLRNGTTAAYVHDADDRLLAVDHTIGATRIAGFEYQRDGEGNPHFERKLHASGASEAFGYDATYRLVDFKVGTLVGSTVPVPATQTQYDLDAVGNWETLTVDGVPEPRLHGVTNQITAIDGVTVTSDPNGNTADDGRYAYAYDEENRLTAVTRTADGRVVGRYRYDALGRRVVRTTDAGAVSSPVETRYVYDDARVVEEQDAGGATRATWVYGNAIDEVVTMDRAGSFYYHQNGLWSVAAITDAAGAVVERYTYDAYGRPTVRDGAGAPIASNPWGTAHSPTGNPWMFTGRQLDEEAGLYFYRARYYDADKGRFLQREPLEYASGMNPYEYAAGRPTALSDPSGDLVILVLGLVAIAAIGYGIYQQAGPSSLPPVPPPPPPAVIRPADPPPDPAQVKMEAQQRERDRLERALVQATHAACRKLGTLSQGSFGNGVSGVFNLVAPDSYPQRDCVGQQEAIMSALRAQMKADGVMLQHYEVVQLANYGSWGAGHVYMGLRNKETGKVEYFADPWRCAKTYTKWTPIAQDTYQPNTEVTPIDLPSATPPKPPGKG